MKDYVPYTIIKKSHKKKKDKAIASVQNCSNSLKQHRVASSSEFLKAYLIKAIAVCCNRLPRSTSPLFTSTHKPALKPQNQQDQKKFFKAKGLHKHSYQMSSGLTTWMHTHFLLSIHKNVFTKQGSHTFPSVLTSTLALTTGPSMMQATAPHSPGASKSHQFLLISALKGSI